MISVGRYHPTVLIEVTVVAISNSIIVLIEGTVIIIPFYIVAITLYL